MDIKKFIDHNRFQVLGVLAGASILFFGVGCLPQVESPFSGNKVSSAQLGAEVEAFNVEQASKEASITEGYDADVGMAQAEFESNVREAKTSATAALRALKLDAAVLGPKVEASYDDLSIQAERTGFFLGIAEQIAELHLGPLLGAAGLAGLIGLGADNVRKNSVIKRQKVGNTV